MRGAGILVCWSVCVWWFVVLCVRCWCVGVLVRWQAVEVAVEEAGGSQGPGGEETTHPDGVVVLFGWRRPSSGEYKVEDLAL